MKKIYSFLMVFTLFMFPFVALAAVDITLVDESLPQMNSVSIVIDSQTDVLNRVTIPIQHSEGVRVSSLSPGDINCSTLNYEDILEDTILVTCELENATALDGILGTIEFSSQTEYFFQVIDSPDLELGGLLLGETNRVDGNIGENEDFEQIAEPVEPIDEFVGDDLTPGEDEFIITTEEGLSPQAEEGFLEIITEFLPYILIGGSVILLISIAAIVLGKKKGPKSDTKKGKKGDKTSPKTPTSPPQTPTTQPEGEQTQSPLTSMVNNVDNSTSQPQEPPVQQPESTQSSPQQNFASTGEEEDDLQEILKRESSTPPMQQAPQEEEKIEEPVVTESPETVMPETPEELQKQVQQEVSGMAGNMTGEETIAPTPPESTTPSPGFDQTQTSTTPSPDFTATPETTPPPSKPTSTTASQFNETQTTTTPSPDFTATPETTTPPPSAPTTSSQPSQSGYPTVPPTASQQAPMAPAKETPEDLPEVPPTM